MGIQENAVRVLRSIATYDKGLDDPERGRYQLSGEDLSKLTGLRPNELSDAVDSLDGDGYVRVRRYLGSHPYSFGVVGLEPRGRLEAEKFSEQPQAHEIDPLLQIRNRGAFDSDLRLILGQCQPAGVPVALLMIDLDHFKSFNDDHGHSAGDKVLREAAATLRRVIGTKGTCYRYGGEELVVLLPNYTQAEVIPLAERIRTSIASIELDGLPRITVSIGVSLTEAAGYDPQELFNAADGAVYAAKAAGRNVVKLSNRVE